MTDGAEQDEEPDERSGVATGNGQGDEEAARTAAESLKSGAGQAADGPAAEERREYWPLRHVPRSEDEPPIENQIDAYANPPDFERAGWEAGEIGGGFLTEKEAFGEDGESGIVAQAINERAAVRVQTVKLHHRERQTELEADVAAAPIKASAEVAAGGEASAAKHRCDDEEAFHRKQAEHERERADEEDRALDGLRDQTDEEERETHASATLLARLSSVPGELLLIVLASDIVAQTLALVPSIKNYVQGISSSLEATALAMVVGALMTCAGLGIGILLADVLGPRRGARVLLASLVGAAGWLLVALIVLREGRDTHALFLVPVSTLTMLVGALVAFSYVVSGDLNKRLRVMRQRLRRKQESVDAHRARAEDHEATAEKLKSRSEGLAAIIEGTLGRVLAALEHGERQKVTLNGHEQYVTDQVDQETAFGRLVLGLARLAFFRSRRTAPPETPKDTVTSNSAVQAVGSRPWWAKTLALIALILIGVAIGLALHSVIPPILAAALGLLLLAMPATSQAVQSSAASAPREPREGIRSLMMRRWGKLPEFLVSTRPGPDSDPDQKQV